MSELVSNINRRIDSIAATEKLRMLTTEEINCQLLLKQLADRIAELENNSKKLERDCIDTRASLKTALSQARMKY